MEEIKCKQVATLRGGKWEKTYEESRRVYGVEGLAPTVHTQGGGNQETKILVEPLAYDEQNGYLRRDGTVGTITTDGSSPKHNNRVVEPKGYEYAGVAVHPVSKKLEFDGYKDTACPTLLATDWKCPKTVLEEMAEPIVYDGFNGQVRTDSTTIGTITRNVGADLKRNGQGIIEPLSEYELSETMKKYINSYDDKYQVSDSKLVLNKKVATPITTREGCSRADSSTYVSPNFPEEQNIARMDVTPFRVRKLTERECFRLQGVKDTDFAKIRQNQSKSSCYHLAGDAISTSVMMALFGQMLNCDWREKVNELVKELCNGIGL